LRPVTGIKYGEDISKELGLHVTDVRIKFGDYQTEFLEHTDRLELSQPPIQLVLGAFSPGGQVAGA
jgi:hypothetical protein